VVEEMKAILVLAMSAASLLLAASPVLAQGAAIILWDRQIATAMNDQLLSEDPCYRTLTPLARASCARIQLNATLERHEFHLTTLDQIALLVHSARNLNLEQNMGSATKVRVRANLSNVYRESAEVKVTLSFRF
jgi:hypothetical protein